MLPKRRRLKNEKDFARVFKHGAKIKEGFLILRFIGKGSGAPRLAVSVSKKISKKATLRNKMKRRLISLAEPMLGNVRKSADFFLSALPGLEDRSKKEIKEMVSRLFIKAKM